MSFQLRSYQNDIVAETRALMHQGVHSILIQSPTGSGKTALTAKMLKTAADKGFDSWFVNHRRELILQSARTFHASGIKAGIVAADFGEDRRRPIQICSVQTLVRRYTYLRAPRLIVWDECHHCAAGSWSRIYDAFPDAFHIGLTATPERLDGKGLERFFKAMVKGPSVSSLIASGYLAPYKLYAPANIDISGVSLRAGDYAKEALAAAADKPSITGDAIAHYLRYAAGKRAVVFCVSIEHSKHVVEQFRAAGIRAAHVDGETDNLVRDAEIKKFERGETLVLSNVELFGEGFDLPAIEAAILLRPTNSLGLYLQQVGRSLRPSPGKENAIILDHAGNCKRHGLPDDEREWTLKGRAWEEGGRTGAGSVKVCPRCFAAQFAGRPVCQFCGHIFEKSPRQVEKRDGELVEVDLVAAKKREQRIEQGKAQTEDDLYEEGIRRGYKPYNARRWAHYVMQSRQAKKLAEGRPA